MGHLSARGFMNGTLREGSFTGDPEGYVSRACKWASSFVGAPLLGNIEAASFLGPSYLEELL